MRVRNPATNGRSITFFHILADIKSPVSRLSFFPNKLLPHQSRVVLELIKVSYHPAKYGGYRHTGSRDIMVFVCHVILLNHLIKRS